MARVDCGRPLAFRALSDKDDGDGYYISGTPVVSSVSQTFSLTLIITCKVVVPCPTFRGGHNAQVAEPHSNQTCQLLCPRLCLGASLSTYEQDTVSN